jgi:hypothetical protein
MTQANAVRTFPVFGFVGGLRKYLISFLFGERREDAPFGIERVGGHNGVDFDVLAHLFIFHI